MVSCMDFAKANQMKPSGQCPLEICTQQFYLFSVCFACVYLVPVEVGGGARVLGSSRCGAASHRVGLQQDGSLVDFKPLGTTTQAELWACPSSGRRRTFDRGNGERKALR